MVYRQSCRGCGSDLPVCGFTNGLFKRLDHIRVDVSRFCGGYWRPVPWIAWMLKPGAIRVRVNEDTVNLDYADGSSRTVSWADSKFRLVVDRTPGLDDSISRGRPMQAVYGRRALQDFLTGPALQAILAGAKSHDLAVSEAPSPRRGWIRLTITRPT